MVVDTLENAWRYCGLHAGFEEAFRLLEEESLAELIDGVRELEGPRLSVNIIAANARPPEEASLEAHRKYIDIQYLLAGEEIFSWKPTSECCLEEQEYEEESDVALFGDEPTGWFPLPEGTFVVFFPEDAHGPMCGEGEIHKVVVKVAVDW